MPWAAGIAEKSGFWEGMWRRLEKRPFAWLVSLLTACVVMFMASIALPRVDGQLTGSDGAFYYSYLPTLLLDHDLDFSNQYAVLLPAHIAARQPLTPDGRPHNRIAIGTAILWTPFFLAGHLVAIASRFFGSSTPLDGMGYVYQIPTLLGSMAYGFAGLLLAFRCCRRFFSAAASGASIILIWLASNLIYYMVAEPSMSHACSFFASALFLNLWLSFRPQPNLAQWALLGLSGGLIALIRLPDATWLALPALDLLAVLREKEKIRLPARIKGVLVYGSAAAVTFLPQWVVWHALNGTAVKSGYAYAGGTFHWSSPEVFKLLFSLQHGLFTWHPVLLAAAAGLFLFYRKEKIAALSMLLVSALQVYLIASWFGWFGGDSFGGRMLITLFPILAIGLAASVQWALARRSFAFAGILAIALIAWNGLFFIQYRFGYIHKLRPPTLYQMTVGKFTMILDFPSRLRGMLR